MSDFSSQSAYRQQHLRRRLSKERLFFDGAMGTQLQKAGLPPGKLPEELNLEQPELIRRIHRDYLDAGADFITTNTFGGNRIKMQHSHYDYRVLLHKAIENARAAQKDAGREQDSYIAFDMGPIGQMLRPLGNLSFEDAYAVYAEAIQEIREEADCILLETQTDLYEVKAAMLAAKENSNLPLFVTMTFEKNARTLSGTDVRTFIETAEGLGADMVGVNCSLGPQELEPIVSDFVRYAHVPILVQPNAGLPVFLNGKTSFPLQAPEFLQAIQRFCPPISVLGGCCGTDMEYIRLLKENCSGTVQPLANERQTTVTSARNTLIFDGEPKICGERLNPTGKKKMQTAIREENWDYLVAEALRQEEAGAAILDVNVGLPGVDEGKVFQMLLPLLQEVVNIPLMIDSSDPKAIEEAARIYNGKPLINSVNGKDEVLQAILPIVKKYGASVIGLTLEEGIPGSGEERFALAQKIMNTAASFEIPKENLIIDCLTLTASAQQKEVQETLRAMQMVKGIGLPCASGVSNVSFGLPNRGLLNRTFFALACYAGLDLAIINPLDRDMVSTLDAYRVLLNQDRESRDYIARHAADAAAKPETVPEKAAAVPDAPAEESDSLSYAIRKGRLKEAVALCLEKLHEQKPLEIVNQTVIPALNQVGKEYENGSVFLPQLMQAAEAAKACFEKIQAQLQNSSDSANEAGKGPVILCTVEGDVHDIGKNIVKVVLESYGYQVIDLGKDVKVGVVVEAWKKYQPKAIGLSALMTTTVGNMRRTIEALHEAGCTTPIWVGGAVLTERIAQEIGADYYSRDALASVQLLEKIL